MPHTNLYKQTNGLKKCLRISPIDAWCLTQVFIHKRENMIDKRLCVHRSFVETIQSCTFWKCASIEIVNTFFPSSLCFAMRFNCVVTTIYCQLVETMEHISNCGFEYNWANNHRPCGVHSMQQIKNKNFNRVATTTEQFIDSSHSLFMQSKSDAFVLCNTTYFGRPNRGNTHLRLRMCAHTEPKRKNILCMHVYSAFTLKFVRTHFGDRITDISSPFFHVFLWMQFASDDEMRTCDKLPNWKNICSIKSHLWLFLWRSMAVAGSQRLYLFLFVEIQTNQIDGYLRWFT